VHAFTDVELLNALKMGDQWNPKRCEILAVLLKEEGDNLLALGNETLATTCFAKALSLFLEIPDQHEKIQDLTLRLKEQVLPDRILHKLFCHYEMKQQYANAENILFELAESRGTSLLQEGREFYARLKEKSREDLRKGNLPMEELDSGWLEFEQLCNTRKLRKEKGDSPG
jgi:hypothetical protein